jgi:putative MATE family efflux protein
MFTGRHILSFLYGSADENVLEASATYLWYSGISFPFIGLLASSSGVLRAGGDSRPPMVASAIANVVNVLLAYILIRLGHGVLGVSIAMLCARILAGVLTFMFLRSGVRGVILPGGKLRLTTEILRPVLRVGVPSGVDSAFFQVARVLMTVFMSGMGTVALHANAIGNSMIMFVLLPGTAFSMVSITMVGQAYGARLFYTVRQYMKKFCAFSAISSAVMFSIVYLLLDPLMSMYSPSAETAELARRLVLIMGVLTPFLHGFAFSIPQMLRACGDAKATMYISVCSLILLRMLGSWFFGIYLDWGVIGVWMGMFLDWTGRGISFGIRAFSNAWNGGKKPVDEPKIH